MVALSADEPLVKRKISLGVTSSFAIHQRTFFVLKSGVIEPTISNDPAFLSTHKTLYFAPPS